MFKEYQIWPNRKCNIALGDPGKYPQCDELVPPCRHLALCPDMYSCLHSSSNPRLDLEMIIRSYQKILLFCGDWLLSWNLLECFPFGVHSCKSAFIFNKHERYQESACKTFLRLHCSPAFLNEKWKSLEFKLFKMIYNFFQGSFWFLQWSESNVLPLHVSQYRGFTVVVTNWTKTN